MTPQQLSKIFEAAYDQSESYGSMSEALYIASLQLGALLGNCDVQTFVEALKLTDNASAIILQDFEFMAKIEGPMNEYGHVLMFSDLSFFVFAQNGIIDTDMRGEIAAHQGGFQALRPTDDMQIIAASKRVPEEMLQPVESEDEAGLRDALCEEIADLHDPYIDPQEYFLPENWSADQQDAVEHWALRTAAALEIPYPMNIHVSSSYEQEPAAVNVTVFGGDRVIEGTTLTTMIEEFFYEVLDLTVGLSEFEGGSYEYADGIPERRSGYAAAPATIINFNFHLDSLSNHQRLQARSIFVKELEDCEILKYDIDSLAQKMAKITEQYSEVSNV
jgi:hypothetical protein